MKSMTTTDSPVALFDFTSDSEDYESPTRGEAVLVLLGTALLAVPVGIISLAVVPFIMGARAASALLKDQGLVRGRSAA